MKILPNPEKQTEECKALGDNIFRCKNFEEIGNSWEYERYVCKVCGAVYYLYYDEMK